MCCGNQEAGPASGGKQALERPPRTYDAINHIESGQNLTEEHVTSCLNQIKDCEFQGTAFSCQHHWLDLQRKVICFWFG